jgi:hypothetical protein
VSGSTPADALLTLAERISGEGELLASRLVRPEVAPVFGELAAAGPRTVSDPAAYALVVEAVREGYLCHYERPRILADVDPDLALLAGDLFYAIGINGLAALDDPESVGILSDLIRVAAELRAEDETEIAEALWLAQLLALACGSDPELAALIEAVERRENTSLQGLKEWSDHMADQRGLGRALKAAQDAIDFRPSNL